MAIDYTQRIPNNVDLASDRRLQRALENWQPRFLDWWKDMGPDGALDFDVYLRTAISAEANGWANFGYVKMPDYRWGIFLAGQDPNRVIAYGDNKGKPAWQEVPGELRSTLRRLIVTQGDTEPASVEQPLLLDRRWLGVALGDDQAAQGRAQLAGHFLPSRLALVVAVGDHAVGILPGEEDPPAIVRHLHIAEVGPAVGLGRDRGAQIDVEVQRAVRPHVLPPVEEARLPVLERALQAAVGREVDVVGNALGVVDGHGCLLSPAARHARLRSYLACLPVP